MNERQTLLVKLVRNGRLSAAEREQLDSFGWDSDVALVVLGRQDMIAMLDRYLRGSISADDLCEWANAIEVRDDVDFEQEHAEALRAVVFEIANPEINVDVSPSSARRWLDRLA